MKPLCVTFAGPPGSSKTPVAFYLSHNLGLPIINTDAIRREIQEDTLKTKPDENELERRRDQRAKGILIKGQDFIYDGSVDRKWSHLKKLLEQHGYDWYIISFELSEGFIAEIARAKQYQASKKLVDRWYDEHQTFMQKFGEEVSLSITDDTFPNRLKISLDALHKCLNHRAVIK